MKKVGLWQVQEGGLKQIVETNLNLEKSLEEWIEKDPSLVQAGLVVIGRQIHLESGILDLLALDHQGRLVIIEIKKGDLNRETIAQVLDYASSISTLPADELRDSVEPYLNRKNLTLDSLLNERQALFTLEPEQRELVMIVVGTGRTPGLDRITQFLSSRYGTPFNVVTFEVFALDDQQKILAREITELETAGLLITKASKITLEQVLELARVSGTETALRKCIETAERLGLYPRPWQTSIMFAPSHNRTRALFTIWAQPKKELIQVWVGNRVFSEFFPVSEKDVADQIGGEGWRSFTEPELETFLNRLQSLFQKILAAEEQSES